MWTALLPTLVGRVAPTRTHLHIFWVTWEPNQRLLGEKCDLNFIECDKKGANIHGCRSTHHHWQDRKCLRVAMSREISNGSGTGYLLKYPPFALIVKVMVVTAISTQSLCLLLAAADQRDLIWISVGAFNKLSIEQPLTVIWWTQHTLWLMCVAVSSGSNWTEAASQCWEGYLMKLIWRSSWTRWCLRVIFITGMSVLCEYLQNIFFLWFVGFCCSVCYLFMLIHNSWILDVISCWSLGIVLHVWESGLLVMIYTSCGNCLKFLQIYLIL